MKNFKIQDGGRRPSWKSKNHDISETFWPILTKFCMMAHINPPKVTSWTKNQTLKIQNGGRPPFSDISATVWPVLVKFGTAMHIRPPNLTVDQKFKHFKIQDGGRRRRPSSKSKNCDISKTVWPILLRFCTITHISSPELTSCSKKLKFWKSKMAEGHHFDNY